MDTWPLNHQNPIELNRYVYAVGNPVTYGDPSGWTSMVTYQRLNASATIIAYAWLRCTVCHEEIHDALLDLIDALDISDDLQDLVDDVTDGDTNNNTGAGALTIAPTQDIIHAREEELETDRGGNWEFVGYHGAAKRYEGAIIQQINPPRGDGNSGFNQLGYGFYVMPYQDPLAWDTAIYFANVATDNGINGERMILLIFALEFSSMSKTQVPVQHWNFPENTSRFPEALYSGYDYLTAPFNDSKAPGSTQIKFNPIAFSRLAACNFDACRYDD